MEASEDSVRQLLASFLKLEPARLTPDARLDELGLDSLAAVELVFVIEERFDVSVPNERATQFHGETVRAIANAVRTLQEATR